ncbi:MAG: aminotransferase class I/II-fold pyridoxal phosphate-dependent enzyme [Clostridiaceae bacterium]|nr:aminotransferase class I/II-fold pyridoxal phosphate-dependent enzyme [Clostridiaceae bacterium]
MKNKQARAPLYEALDQYANAGLVHFDVPGHKKRLHDGLGEFIGERTVQLDANSTKELDMLSNPTGIIREAEVLLADAYGADYAYMLVNGSTFGVQAMIMAACGPKDKIILPRNVHKSAINGIILSGAVPVFVEPEINREYGIANGISYEQVKRAIHDNPDAKAVLLINPTYFGVVSDIRAIIKLCHRHQMMVLADEAHGAHFPFYPEFPDNASASGADLATVSMHKTGGSLTQSSVLLLNERIITHSQMLTVINLMQTTSASYLLMASLDLARRNLVMEGQARYDVIFRAVEEAKRKLIATPGLQVLTREDINGQGFYDYDETKIVVKVNDLGLTGFQVYDLMRQEFNIQLELAETYVVLAVVGIGDDESTINRLVEALQSIAGRYYGRQNPFLLDQSSLFEKPMTVVSPREAFYSPKRLVPIDKAVGEICAESIMIYPPGIPLAIPGEKMSQNIVDHYQFYRQQNCVVMNNADDPDMIQVLGEPTE